MLTTIPTSATRPFALRTAVLLARPRRLINRFFAAVIARHERHAARVALHRLDDRQLQDSHVPLARSTAGSKNWRRPARECSSLVGTDGCGVAVERAIQDGARRIALAGFQFTTCVAASALSTAAMVRDRGILVAVIETLTGSRASSHVPDASGLCRMDSTRRHLASAGIHVIPARR